MKTSTIKIIFLLFIFLTINVFSQIGEDWYGYKVSIPFIRIVKVRPIKEISDRQTMVYPPQTSYKIVGYTYTLELTISIHGDKKDFTSSIPIIFKTPTGEEIVFTFNAEKLSLQSSQLYDFVCDVPIKQKGYTQVGFLRKLSEFEKPVAVYENGLRLE